MTPLAKFLWYVSMAVALALVFVMYTRPDFMFKLANLVWGCF
jgi:hypothetical protein